MNPQVRRQREGGRRPAVSPSVPTSLFLRTSSFPRGFTLFEMMITLVIMVMLVGMIFTLMTGILQSAATLQDNENRGDQISALYDFVKTKLTMMPARSTLASYTRGDGEGLVQNGIIFGNTNLATALDGKIQPNGLYQIRITTLATSASGQESRTRA